MRTMQGTPSVPFSELFKSTIDNLGLDWARHYYTRNGMSFSEFDFWHLSYQLNA